MKCLATFSVLLIAAQLIQAVSLRETPKSYKSRLLDLDAQDAMDKPVPEADVNISEIIDEPQTDSDLQTEEPEGEAPEISLGGDGDGTYHPQELGTYENENTSDDSVTWHWTYVTVSCIDRDGTMYEACQRVFDKQVRGPCKMIKDGCILRDPE